MAADKETKDQGSEPAPEGKEPANAPTTAENKPTPGADEAVVADLKKRQAGLNRKLGQYAEFEKRAKAAGFESLDALLEQAARPPASDEPSRPRKGREASADAREPINPDQFYNAQGEFDPALLVQFLDARQDERDTSKELESGVRRETRYIRDSLDEVNEGVLEGEDDLGMMAALVTDRVTALSAGNPASRSTVGQAAKESKEWLDRYHVARIAKEERQAAANRATEPPADGGGAGGRADVEPKFDAANATTEELEAHLRERSRATVEAALKEARGG